jgi:hypothetical protein
VQQRDENRHNLGATDFTLVEEMCNARFLHFSQ